jgi:hypothetical protein
VRRLRAGYHSGGLQTIGEAQRKREDFRNALFQVVRISCVCRNAVGGPGFG